jgi:hypothetical protein
MRTHVTLDEFDSGRITEKVSSLHEIKIGEAFIAVRAVPLPPDQEWPVFDRTAAGCVSRVAARGGGVEHIPGYYEIYRVKE